MAIENKRDFTKSVAWLALDKETQEKLISIAVKRRAEGLLEHQRESLHGNLRFEIHRALGMETGHAGYLNRQLKEILWEYTGGIYDEIRNYLDKYEAIEGAVKTIAKERVKDENKGRG